jgi:hypothetical protein
MHHHQLRLPHATSSDIPIDPILIMQSRSQHQTLSTPVPPEQQRIGIPQPASPQTHRALSDSGRVSTQTSCEINEDDSDDSEVQYEDEIRSSNGNSGNEEEEEQVQHGSFKMNQDDVHYGTTSEINENNVHHGIDVDGDPDHIVARNNASHIDDDDRDNSYPGFDLDAGIHDIEPQEPLLGKLSLNKHLRFLAYRCRTWLRPITVRR